MEVIESQIIDYEDGPEGKAYIGWAKRPLMKTPTGIGFLGTKVQSPDRTEIQCSECGFYFKFITAKHLASHGMRKQEMQKCLDEGNYPVWYYWKEGATTQFGVMCLSKSLTSQK